MHKLRNIITGIITGLTDSQEKQEMLLGSGITLGMKVFGMGLSYLSLLVIARFFGAQVMGGLALALVVYNIFSLPGACGARDAIVRFTTEGTTDDGGASGRVYRKLVAFFLLLSVISGGCLLAASGFLAQTVFGKPELSTAFCIMAAAVPVGALAFTNMATLRGLKRIAESSFLAIMLPVTINLLLVMVLMPVVGKRVETVVLAQLGSLALSAAVGVLLLTRKGGLKGGKEAALPLRKIISVAAPMFVSSGMILVFGWADTFMLGIFSPGEDIGIYRVAFKIAALSAFSLDAVGSIAAAQFAAAKEDEGELRSIVIHSSRLIFWAASPIILVSFIFSSFVLNIFGADFIRGLVCLRILILAQVVNVACGLVGVLLNICGGQKPYRNAMVLASALNIVLDLWLIPRYGITGAAVATAISIVAGNTFAALTAYRMFGFWAGIRFGR